MLDPVRCTFFLSRSFLALSRTFLATMDSTNPIVPVGNIHVYDHPSHDIDNATNHGASITTEIRLFDPGATGSATSHRTLLEPGDSMMYGVDSKTFSILIGAPEVVITNIVTQHPGNKIKIRRTIKKLRQSAAFERSKLPNLHKERHRLVALLATFDDKIKAKKSD